MASRMANAMANTWHRNRNRKRTIVVVGRTANAARALAPTRRKGASADNTFDDDGGNIRMRNLEDIIGRTIATDLTASQEQLVMAAIAENEPGVERLAQRVMANPNTRSPVPTFLSAIKRRQHIARPAKERSSATRLSTLEQAERLYHAKIAQLNEYGVLGAGWTQQDAIAYAIDYTKGANDQTEAALRERLGLPAYVSVPAPPEALEAIRKLLG